MLFNQDNDTLDDDEKNTRMLETLQGYLGDELPVVTNLANMAAILYAFLEDINWAGFYLFQDDRLVLGPFQGKPACTEIKIGKGVCGLAAENMQSMVVPDVNEFDGHITCDSASRSEIVLPIVKNGQLFGVLDIDSPSVDRFDEKDHLMLQESVRLLIDILP